MKFAGSKEMYKDSPKLARSADGKVGVSKGPSDDEKKSDEVDEGVDGMEKHEVHSRHNLERHMMHARHEHEHHAHEKHGSSKEMLHEKHAKEHGDMLKNHDKELGSEGAEE